MKLTDPIFHDTDQAREWFEAQRWPNGPICPHCTNSDQTKISRLEGGAHRPGLFKCYDPKCRKQFSVSVGTVMERSHIPLNVWAMAMFIMAGAKKGISARQMARMMDVPLKTAWFLAHRIREAMKPVDPLPPIGGKKKIIEADETFIGGKGHNRAFREPAKKKAVLTLVQRDGESRSFHVPNIKAKTLREAIVRTADRKSFLMFSRERLSRWSGDFFAGEKPPESG
jgi:transposase-like protein